MNLLSTLVVRLSTASFLSEAQKGISSSSIGGWGAVLLPRLNPPPEEGCSRRAGRSEYSSSPAE